MHIFKFALVGAFGLLAACGQTNTERAFTGALAGAVIADAAGGSARTGALVGAAAGALCDDVNLCPQR